MNQQIIKKAGGSLSDSYLDEGFILDKKIGVGQPKARSALPALSLSLTTTLALTICQAPSVHLSESSL